MAKSYNYIYSLVDVLAEVHEIRENVKEREVVGLEQMAVMEVNEKEKENMKDSQVLQLLLVVVALCKVNYNFNIIYYKIHFIMLNLLNI